MKRSGLLSIFAVALLLSASRLHASCGPVAVCTDVVTSLRGEVVAEGITLSWATDDETSGVTLYKIYRYSCTEPSTCSTLVTALSATGTCETVEDYEYTDHPASPLSQWKYVVEVWRVDGARQCAVDVTPD